MSIEQITHRHRLAWGGNDNDLARESLRYQALRTLNPLQFHALWRASFLTNATFDDLVDAIVISRHDEAIQHAPDSPRPKRKVVV